VLAILFIHFHETTFDELIPLTCLLALSGELL
jgi:hypothetical protein